MKTEDVFMEPDKMIIFIDCGDTLVDESTQIMSESGDVLQAELIEGAKDTLISLYESGHRIALVADGRTASFQNILKHHRLMYLFETMVISEEIGVEKPDEQIFRVAMERMNLSMQDCGRIIMVGNNLKRDILGANRMGFHTILLSYSPRYCMEPENFEEQPDYTIPLPGQLPDLVTRLERRFCADNHMITKGDQP